VAVGALAGLLATSRSGGHHEFTEASTGGHPGSDGAAN
jgi:hypothetical protein